jgi:hypothetical protein
MKWVSVDFAVPIMALILGATACAPSKVSFDLSPEIQKYQIKTIAVVPFDSMETPQITETRNPEFFVPEGAKRSDISLGQPDVTFKLDHPTYVVPTFAAEKVTRMIYVRLQNKGGIQVIPPEQVADAFRATGLQQKEVAVGPMAQTIARQLKVDAVLLGRLLVYQERGGSKFGGDPATVGFEVKLVAADGRILWVGNYYEQQRPMNEDLVGFIQRGGVFVTAEELAEYGADRIMREIPLGNPIARPVS